MLIQFTVENHRSIKNSAVIVLRPLRISHLKSICFIQMKRRHCCPYLQFTVPMQPEKVTYYMQ